MASPPPLRLIEGSDPFAGFDAIIDVRSPAEFAEDHVPGAINLPVLDDAQRAQVGTLYSQDSPFVARRLGAALVARNIAAHLEERLQQHPRPWKPLVYCWRGGQRSGAMTTVLGQVGWGARQLEGGYRAYRRRVLTDLEAWPARFAFIVLCGPTGSGKTAVLEALHAQGAQTLNLEALAQHRGSVLGGSLEDTDPQPGQKAFESAMWDVLRRCDPQRPVYVESESRRIGRLGIPAGLFAALTASPCLRLEASLEVRIAHLVERYADIYGQPAALRRRLEFFVPLHGRVLVEKWQRWVDEGNWEALAEAMVSSHYDPAYRRGGDSLYRAKAAGPAVPLDSLAPDAIMQVAQHILGLPRQPAEPQCP